MQDLTLVVNSIFDLMTRIFNLYMSQWILTSVLALWLLRRVFKIFNLL